MEARQASRDLEFISFLTNFTHMEKTLIIVEFTAKAKKQDICDGAGEGGGEVEIYLL